MRRSKLVAVLTRAVLTRAVLTRAAAVTVACVVGAGVAAWPAQAIVDGRDASTRQYPWMVLLSSVKDTGKLSGHFCGGTLVAPTKVITAAHCVDDKRAEDFQVIGGRSDLRRTDGTVRAVRSVWNAPKSTPPPGEPKFLTGGDLSVLTLAEPMPYRTLPIARAGDAHLYQPGRPGLLLGWGVYAEAGLPGPSPILRQGRAPVLPYATCNEAMKQHPAMPAQLDPRYHVCIGDQRGGPAGCGGDSGGPLVVHGRLAGVFGPIVSRAGQVCAGAYSGFTRVDTYADLIAEQLS